MMNKVVEGIEMYSNSEQHYIIILHMLIDESCE